MSDLQEQLDTLMEAFENIKREVRTRDSYLYERWKAGGFAVDGNFVSMYPAVEEVVEQLGEEDDEDEEDEESADDSEGE